MSFLRNNATSITKPNELANDLLLQNPPLDTISDLSFSTVAQNGTEFLSVASWDNSVRIYQINTMNGSNEGKAMYQHEGPVLSTRWSTDGTKVVSGGADKQVKLYDVASGQAQQIGQHNDAVKSVRFALCGPSNTPAVVSGSWDKTLKYWDLRTPNPIATIDLDERCYVMDVSQKLLVAGTAKKTFTIINLDNPTVKFRESNSPLKLQLTSLACFPNGGGFAAGSIEGRLSIQYADEAEQKQKGFSFKCHRDSKTEGGRTENRIYTLNAIAFHPIHSTFVTCGSDGSFSFWDKDLKHRLKSHVGFGVPITAANFNNNGSMFVYSLGYDWSKGYQFSKQDNSVAIRVHPVKEEEVKKLK